MNVIYVVYLIFCRHKRLVVTFPNTTDDFAMPCGVFQRACYKCMASGEKSQLDLKR